MVDGTFLNDRSDSKNMVEISHSIDSLNARADSVGRSMYHEIKNSTYRKFTVTARDSARVEKGELPTYINTDSHS